MKNIWKYIITVGVIGIIAGIIVSLYVFRELDDNVANKKAEFKVTCQQIVNEFESDEQQAGLKYNYKIVEIDGIIAEMNSDSNGVIILLREPDAISGVSCSIGKSQEIDKGKCKTGNKVTVKGICTGYLMDVVMNRGAVVSL